MQKFPNVRRVVGAVAVQVSNVLILDKMIESFLNDLCIVFYTNIVKYPNVLSIQVLPEPLKKLAIERLEESKKHVHEYVFVKENPILLDITLGQINGIINFLKANNNSHKWEDCIDFNHKLDRSRKQKLFEEINPEFKDFIVRKDV
jgi:hypothetical protein